MTPDIAALGVGGIAALLGAGLLRRRLAGRPPVWIALHVAAVLGCTLLVAVQSALAPISLLRNSALLLLVAALIGGGFNGLFRLQGESPPGLTVALHALAGLVGLALLAAALVGCA